MSPWCLPLGDNNGILLIYHNSIATLFLYTDYLLLYLCDTEEGSSGSPIVKTTTDKQRHVIGLHRGDIELNTENYNFGFTMSAIINDIHKKHPKYGVL